MSVGFATAVKIAKVDEALGLVIGYAIVCTEKGAPYVDLQNDEIPEEEMLAAALDFMKSQRVAKEMHAGPDKGTVVFAFPLTAEIAKSLDVTTPRTGLLIGVHFDDAAILRKYADGSYTGFSIGGISAATEEAA